MPGVSPDQALGLRLTCQDQGWPARCVYLSRVRITARTGAGLLTCPGCRTPSARVHDRYRRRLRDLSCGGRPVQVELAVRRMRCDTPACPVATFAEQLPGLTGRHQRRTAQLRGLLERVALALAGRAGARLAGALGAVVSRCTLIRLVRALPDPAIGQVTMPRSARIAAARCGGELFRFGAHDRSDLIDTPTRFRDMDCPGPDGLAWASGRAALRGYPAWTISALASSLAGLAGVVWAPARSARLTRTAAMVTMRAISMIPADTSNPRPKPTDSAWS
jgi:hypothetical protein